MRINERNFIKYLQAGQEKALDYVIDHYLPLIKGIVVKTLGPIHRADLTKECINDILFSIWQNASKFSGDTTDFQKWICVISKYKAIDYYRTELKRKESPFIDMEATLADSAIKKSSRMEEYEEIQEILSSLKPADQKIFVMKYLLDLNTEEIAHQLQMTKSAVDNRLYHGKKKLKKAWGGISIEKSI
ncbi:MULTISPECIES: sigma-70 family RNA polymerase sigma factor [unclassified Solibacillus]|uniref:sigma-70 family RNA polymerase sigma factor n=1 Tax=unclassified Solibacillus TaxID=2637870 RepID=UPI0030F6D869